MDFLLLTASLTKRRPIFNTLITEVADVPPLSYGDALSGTIIAVAETFDPTGPTSPVALDSSAGVAITDGDGTIYANGIIIGIQNGNEIHFTMTVAGAALLAALTAETQNKFISAVLEVRASVGGQDCILLSEDITIKKSATGLGALATTPAAIPGAIFNWLINAKEEIDDISVSNLATLTLLICSFVIDGYKQQSSWQLMTGAYDATDPDGSRPAGEDILTRHWQKIG